MAAKCCGQHQSEAVVGRRYWRPRMRRGRAHQSEKGSIIEAQGTPTDETLELTFTRPSEDVSDCAKLAVTVNDHDSTAVPSKTRTSSIRPMSIDWSALSEHVANAPATAHSNASSTTVHESESNCRIAPSDQYGWEADWDRKLSTSSSVRRQCLFRRNLLHRLFGLCGSVVPNHTRSTSFSDSE